VNDLIYDKFRGRGYFVFLNFSLFLRFRERHLGVAAILRGCFGAREVLLLLGLGERLNSLALRLRNCTLARKQTFRSRPDDVMSGFAPMSVIQDDRGE
jgi:hypothetical protein